MATSSVSTDAALPLIQKPKSADPVEPHRLPGKIGYGEMRANSKYSSCGFSSIGLGVAALIANDPSVSKWMAVAGVCINVFAPIGTWVLYDVYKSAHADKKAHYAKQTVVSITSAAVGTVFNGVIAAVYFLK